MWLGHCLFLCAALTATAVKVDVQGSLTLGSQVAEFLADNLQDEFLDELSGRRTMTDALGELIKVVKQMRPCKNATVCTPKLEKFIIEYVTDLTTGIKTVFDGVLEDELCKVKYFEKCLKHVRKVVSSAALDTDEVHRWINVLKKISGIYLEQATSLARQGLDTAEKKEEAMHSLKQQLVFTITDLEKNYENILCKEFRLCPYQFDVTIYLQLLLNLIRTMKENNVRLFLNQFKKKFLHTAMFTDDVVMKINFEEVLREMLLNKTIDTKGIVLSIADVVQKRLAGTESTERDATLLQMILSDMDHIYVSNKDEHIEKFLDVVKTWLKSEDDVTLGDGMEAFCNSLAAHFQNHPKEIIFKLQTEAQVFLGLTAHYTPPAMR
ncbi:uncharacterized protein LOC125241872 [Leguminivora glycinivorella]|uniref:uncharacterized protein LOC125241872 n=1 Tax=Leguminivora glycinivorella TaxID=1035111 RepID=UPI00201031C2|nr:uncharacterized protein LOC125241872 [Leguminivora glycinivorella]